MRSGIGLALSMLLLGIPACTSRDDLDGRRRPIPGLAARGQPYVLELGPHRTVLDFYDHRPAAVLHEDDALVIDCGSIDMLKYIDGRYRNPWHVQVRDRASGNLPVALVDGLAGELYLPIDRDPGGVAARGTGLGTGDLTISLRARAAVPNQLVSVLMNEVRLGDIAMPTTEWQTYRIKAPAHTVVTGENKLRLYFRHAGDIGGIRTAAALARIRIGKVGLIDRDADVPPQMANVPASAPASAPATGPAAVDAATSSAQSSTGTKESTASAAPGGREGVARTADATKPQAPLTGGGRTPLRGNVPLQAANVVRAGARMAALRVAHRSRLSFYVHVPASAPALVFAYGSDARASVPVRIQIRSDGQEDAQEIWQGTAQGDWASAHIDVSNYADQVVRIDFLSTGPVDWGRPRLVTGEREREPEHRPVPADHIIVWVVSALRADRVYGDGQADKADTPHFSRFMARGLRAEHAYGAAPLPGPAHVALLTGRAPRGHTITADSDTLATRMSAAGYTTALISGNGFVNDEAGFARGFDLYENPMRRRRPYQARVLWQRARRFIERHTKGRTFSYIVTVEPHLPYQPSPESLQAAWHGENGRPRPIVPLGAGGDTAALAAAVAAGTRKLTSDERAYISALYNAEVRDADAAFGAMLDDLHRLGVADRTAVVLLADHGEELWERGGFGHGTHLHQEVLRIPLVIAPAGSLSRGVNADSARTLEGDIGAFDIHASILDLAGLAPGPGGQGESVLGVRSPGPVPIFSVLPDRTRRARALKLGRYKWIVPRHGNHVLYDVSADPGESRDVADAHPVVERYMRNAFSLGVAYERVWSRQRWGHAAALGAAFAADHGL